MSRYEVTFYATNDDIALDSNDEVVIGDITNGITPVVYSVYDINQELENVGKIKESPGMVLKDPFVNRDKFEILTSNTLIAAWKTTLANLKTILVKKNKYLKVNTFPYIPHAANNAIPVVITDLSFETAAPNKFITFSLQKTHVNT